jgi:hypothetical protein
MPSRCSRLAALSALAVLVLVPPAHADRARAAASYPAGALRPAFPASAVREGRRGSAGGQRALAATAHARGRARSKPRKARKPRFRGDPARALAAFEAMQHQYYLQGSGLYLGEPYSYLWPFSQALAATVSMSDIPGMTALFKREVHLRLLALRSYLDTTNSSAPEGVFTSRLAAFDGAVAPPAGPGGAKYYDDNEWIGIELARLYEQSHNATLLGLAEGIMAFVMDGWSTNAELACPGGLPFSNDSENTDRNTVTDAPGAELAAQLYRITGNAQYLRFAEMAYEWVRRCLLEPSGMYADHIREHGVVDPTLWSYNQGTMIGAGALLYQATSNGAFLAQARQTAGAALAYFTPERLGAEIPFFPSIFFRNVLYLNSVVHDVPAVKVAQSYADYAWQHLRLANGLFVFGSPPSSQLLVQAALVQVYALLSSPPLTYF